MKRRDALTFGLAAMIAGAQVLGRASAQSPYPERPIKLVIPFAPGGLTDFVGRQWADKMKALLGPVFTEHQPGAGGAIGAAAVARASPDGYTLLLGSASQVLIPAAGRGPYDPIRDFVPISMLVGAALTIAIHPAVPARSLQELLGYARANPGKLSYASGGVGSTGHLTGELFKALAGTPDIVHIPYKGAGQMIGDLLNGHVPVLVINVSAQVRDLHEAGKLKMLAVTTAMRTKIAPNVPTAVESGLPDMIFENFTGLFAPAGTPKPIVHQIATATRAAMADDEFRQKLIASGFVPYVDFGPEKARRFVEEQIAHGTPMIKAIGLKLE